MKYLTTISLLLGVLLTFAINPSFGEITSVDGEFYSDDKRLHDTILKAGKEVQVKVNFFHDSDSSDLADTEIFVIDNPTSLGVPDEFSVVEVLHDEEFELDSNSPKLYIFPYTPNQVGNYAYVISTSLQDKTVQSILDFVTVDDFGKTFEENNGCRGGFHSIIKPNYSTVVCVTENTHNVLVQRGWQPSPFD